GSLSDLRRVASAVTVPVLRKDFILSEEQVLEARAAGASALLLIVRALEARRLRELLQFTEELHMAGLVEVHTAKELAIALDADAQVIGVNSRDLDTFRIDVEAAWALLADVPDDRVAVAESGMATVGDVARAARGGADAVLVGTALSASDSPTGLVRAMTEVQRHGR
ncbi:MAG TPA: indole-3-glycerol-phosphate synthase, partial [Gemmatimonadales bacterium]|nr:indole-3-glycerol-phosphate synthase [Gemmatimonadales bacterium]